MATGNLLMLHVTAGTIGLVAGAAAMLLRKGAFAHRMAGRTFSTAMLCMSLSSVYLACTGHQPDNVIVGALTFYLVATGWLAVLGRSTATRAGEGAALAGVLAIAAAALAFGVEASSRATGVAGGVDSGNFFFMAAVALCFAAFDVRSIVIGGGSGARRFPRHPWRMGLAMFMATLSVFIGQAAMFPAVLRESHALVVPVALVAAATVFWLLKSRRASVSVVAMMAVASMQAHAADWSDAASAGEIVVVTHDPDERVRETTVWVVVVDGSAFLRTSGTRWGRNVDRDPDMVLRVAGTDYPVSAERVPDQVLVDRVQAAFRQKYGVADRAARFVRFVLGGSRIYRVTAR